MPPFQAVLRNVIENVTVNTSVCELKSVVSRCTKVSNKSGQQSKLRLLSLERVMI
jgi:hypothetical protein